MRDFKPFDAGVSSDSPQRSSGTRPLLEASRSVTRVASLHWMSVSSVLIRTSAPIIADQEPIDSAAQCPNVDLLAQTDGLIKGVSSNLLPCVQYCAQQGEM